MSVYVLIISTTSFTRSLFIEFNLISLCFLIFFKILFNFISFVQVLVYNSFTFIILKSRYNIRFKHILCARTLSRSFIFPLTQIVITRPQSILRESWPAGNKKYLIKSVSNQKIRFKSLKNNQKIIMTIINKTIGDLNN